MNLLFYCRRGYESDLCAEIEHRLSEFGHYGYAKFTKESGFVEFTVSSLAECIKFSDLEKFSNKFPRFNDVMFARQKLWLITEQDLEPDDRVSSVLEVVNRYIDLACMPAKFSKVLVEYPDTEDGKALAKFAKKFSVPLRTALRKNNLLSNKEHDNGVFLHLFMLNSQNARFAVSLPGDRSLHSCGIQRLRMPNDAPSRSTLKLEEAIKHFFTDRQQRELFQKGMRAVDLGACPGGWTYQLVIRGLTVEAVDHGKIDEHLISTGRVEYYCEDGFIYQPSQGNVEWLVCDMIEQPTRVSKLMLKWLVEGRCNAALFNLKLPMNKRFKVVQAILDDMKQSLRDKFGAVHISAQHLYHNRDEVTLVVIVNSQMLSLLNNT